MWNKAYEFAAMLLVLIFITSCLGAMLSESQYEYPGVATNRQAEEAMARIAAAANLKGKPYREIADHIITTHLSE